MIETPALVTRTEGDTAWVTSKASSSCGACGGKGCGSSLYARLWHPTEPEYQVENPIGAREGDTVVIGLPDGALLRAASISYAVPVFLLLGGAGLGNFAAGEPGAIAGGLFGLAVAGIRLRMHKISGDSPRILRRDEHSGHACGTRGG